ncbi:hypothetical protein [Phenylobacterium sp.]|jgi:hypothetical protein|uniref:hypothetical protein n=1 Tax=Phenylobacterium sp. TaxID=1871053 RepID=UPI002F3EEC0F
MEKTLSSIDAGGRPAVQGRSFAKDIAELALFLDLTEPTPEGHLETAITEITQDRPIPPSTLKRCASEARALMEHAQETGLIIQIERQGDHSEWAVRGALSAWLDEINLTAILKQRALRLNRSRGGRPPSQTRTLRAVKELMAFAQAGRPGAVDELRSIRALIGEDA